MRIESENLRCAVRIERQIQARAYADLQHTALGQPDGSLSIRCKLPIPHRKTHKVRQDVFLVDSHHLSPKASFQNRDYFSPPPIEFLMQFRMSLHVLLATQLPQRLLQISDQVIGVLQS